jgi:hypothetical protein
MRKTWVRANCFKSVNRDYKINKIISAPYDKFKLLEVTELLDFYDDVKIEITKY